MTVLLASIYRSTQFIMHGSSERSSLPEEIFEVTHLRKQVSVRLWTCASASVREYHMRNRIWKDGEMYALLYLRFLRLLHDELVQIRLVFCAEVLQGRGVFGGDVEVVHL